MKRARTVLIAGPTASGKSSAALALAEALGGTPGATIVNADAMQVYRDLRILTARPGAEDERAAAHRLYGVLDGAERCSAGRWARLAAAAIDEISQEGGTAIVAGGTGLYFRALEEGLSPIPEAPPEIREKAEARWRDLGSAAFREEVVAQDPAMARLPEGDAQRLKRAWEVFAATGKPISHFQMQAPVPLIEGVDARIVIEPPRDVLYARCDARAAAMLEEGAIEEARALIGRGLDPALPVMKALGVAEIAGLLKGELNRDEALALLQQNTRRYAKRQLTWFRNQASYWPRAETAEAAVAAIRKRLAAGAG
ncbi:tRNA (adenosine(37)-N6)-dimethylallyltransferase MiaA [Hyphococcus luteus]|uniref:tRNA dimethylallyltransferase n=1 Tax=Hyphococcus luteus TaxID=2058213 RepID=A0A2S7K4B0_9PROT|nr:tRNA (adenosine(37)-N6)-dimethylallyltransferase MiaA [Marinicaulis flavus]PQA87335.1 tRNA (adenosine(37)-N6)-dimethylallyltransferase MiaA [Marinicaulis flavus]